MTLPTFVSFNFNGKSGYGILKNDGVVDLSARFASRWRNLKEVVAANAFEILSEASTAWSADLAKQNIAFDIPIPNPGKILCVGVNYPDRNEEYKDGQTAPDNPSIFVRFPLSFVGHDTPIIRPPESEQLDYEGEIAIVLGKAGRRISEANALDHIAALSLCNEGTIRDWTRHAKFNVTQGKNFDRTGSMGPGLVPLINEAQISDIRLETRVNGQVRQRDRTSRMIFSFRRIVSYVSTFTTLLPGDVILTGTPTGAGARFDPPVWLRPGDIVEVEADGIGRLSNVIQDEA